MNNGRGRRRTGGSRYNSRGTTRRGASVGSGRRETLDIQLKLMLITAIVSETTYGICSLLYMGLQFTMVKAGLIGLLFSVLYVTTAVSVAVYSAVNDFFSENFFTGGGLGINILFMIGGAFVVFFFGMFLQALYGLGGNTADLLTRRPVMDLGILYGFLRILFCTLMGTVVGIGHAMAFGRTDTMGFTFFASAAKAFVGAIILEGGIQVLHAPLGIALSLYWMMIGTAFLMAPARRVRRQSRSLR
uniref:hypothetical protein n=1 Tax=Eubacterium cellulosolvens TaxID=29322 RepID=UPI0012DD93A6|nr:hypothetical protein [[Eubacterium] cellulosolvens]